MAKVDCGGLWTPSQLLNWEQSLCEEYWDWEGDKARWETRFDKRIDKVSEREISALACEKELTKPEGHLAGREGAICSREMDLAGREEKLLAGAYKFCRDLLCCHQVS